MLEPAFITLQAIMTKAAEMMEHYQAISSKSSQGNAVLVWTQPSKPVCVVWPFCQAETSGHQGKHALGTGKQPLMDRVTEVSSFQKENEMYF